MDMLKKFPRTPHFPFSETVTSDDRIIEAQALQNIKALNDIIVTEKMDGGNYNMTTDHAYSRSIDSTAQLWDNAAKQIWGQIRYDIPRNIRLSGESMKAERSVAYRNLQSPFLIFAVWQDDLLLSWDETTEWAELLNLHTVPLLYRGNNFDEAINAWHNSGYNPDISEGFVLRNASSFSYDDYGSQVAKYVRADHVRTSADWRSRDDFATNSFL